MIFLNISRLLLYVYVRVVVSRSIPINPVQISLARAVQLREATPQTSGLFLRPQSPEPLSHPPLTRHQTARRPTLNSVVSGGRRDLHRQRRTSPSVARPRQARRRGRPSRVMPFSYSQSGHDALHYCCTRGDTKQRSHAHAIRGLLTFKVATLSHLPTGARRRACACPQAKPGPVPRRACCRSHRRRVPRRLPCGQCLPHVLLIELVRRDLTPQFETSIRSRFWASA